MTKKLSRKQISEIGFCSNSDETLNSIDNASQERLDILQSRRETADYVRKMSADLGDLAARAELKFLAYLLDMARMEASDRCNDDEQTREINIV